MFVGPSSYNCDFFGKKAVGFFQTTFFENIRATFVNFSGAFLVNLRIEKQDYLSYNTGLYETYF